MFRSADILPDLKSLLMDLREKFKADTHTASRNVDGISAAQAVSGARRPVFSMPSETFKLIF